MRRRTEFKKTPPRFSRTFDLLMSRFPDVVDLSSYMASNRTSVSSGQWRPPVSAPLCVACNKTVYPAEEANGAGQKYHKLCLKCTACNTSLTSGNLNEREKKIYCGGCYRRLFGPRGLGRGLANCYLETPPNTPNSNQDESESNSDESAFEQKLSLSSPDDDRHQTASLPFSSGITAREKTPVTKRPTSTSVINGTAFKMMSISGNTCPRCSKTVYSAEEVKAAGKSYHKRCYTCANCKGSISGGRYSERNGELYDNNCYQRLFGPKGVGFGIGAGVLSSDK